MMALPPAQRLARGTCLFVTAVSLAFGTLALSGSNAHAQGQYPNRSIRVVVPFAPGGSTDLVARLVASRVSVILRTPLVVENRPGANGNIGADAVAKSAPDGYTLLHGTSSLAFTAAFKQKVSYNLATDLIPVSQVIDQPLLIMTSKQTGITTWRELIAYSQAHPESLNYGSSGNGNLTHLAMYVLLQSASLQATHIPYKGGAGAFPDFIAGRLNLLADPINSAYPYVRDQRVTALLVTGEQRSALLPHTPTASEAALPGFHMGAWQALMLPAGTPSTVVDILNKAYAAALKESAVRETLATWGAVPVGSSPAAFREFLNAEIDRWAAVVKTSGIVLE